MLRIPSAASVVALLLAGSVFGSVACNENIIIQATRKDAGAKPTGDGGEEIPTGDVCKIARAGSGGVVIRGTLLLPEGEPKDGEVAFDTSGKITCIGSCDSAAPQAALLDCSGGGIISPSLVNAHDHTDYNVRGPYSVEKTRWTWRQGWRTGALGEKKLPSMPKVNGNTESAIAELRFVFGGTAAVVGSGGIDGLIRNLATFPKNADTADTTSKTANFDTFPLKDQDGSQTPAACDPGSVVNTGSAFRGGNYVPHVGEGIAEAAQNEFACLSQGSVGVITNRTAMIHSVGFGAAEAEAAKTAGAQVIWSPRSNIVLYGNTAPIPLFKRTGLTIALGTDWLPSGSMNMLRELQCASSLNDKYFAKALTDRDLFDIATRNGAIAAGFGSELGLLKVGYAADITIFDGRAHKGFRAVIDAATEDVRLVLRGGKPLYGDGPLVDAIAQGCEAATICGLDRRVCLGDVKGGVKWADVEASVKGGNYALFFCRGEAVKDEPSCVPYRDTYPDGTSATDRDGDGIPDASDDCPDVFNPPRPMDGDKQADADNDGAGDACDAKPLDNSSK